MHCVFQALWQETWPANAESNFSDPTICFLAIFTLEKDGHFKQPKAVTKPLAQLCRAIRLSVLMEIHRLVTTGSASSMLDAFESLSWTVREGNTSTFHKLRFYQHYASAIAYQTISLPKIIWPFREDGRFDIMLYLGQLASLQKLLDIIRDLEVEAKEIWEKRILRGAVLQWARGILADNLRDTSQGYSFLQDAANGLEERRHDLGRHLLETVFLQNIPGSTQKSLNVAEVRVWLNDLARLEAILLLLVEMKSGAPIRMAELCSTLAHNTEFRLRNLMALGKRIVLIRQYTKTTHNKQMDSLIPSLMAAFDADMIFCIHVFARPVAQVWVTLLGRLYRR